MRFQSDTVNHAAIIRLRCFEHCDGRNLVGPPHNVLLVPDRAIVSDQSRKIILAVNDKNEVVARPVTTGPMHDGLLAIESGLQPNERIIIEGQMWARPGATVSPKMVSRI